MMRGKAAGLAAVLLFAGAATSAAPPKKPARSEDQAAIAKTLDCARHRFEATIRVDGPDGKPQDQTVRMCGIKGETDAEWIETLKDAVRKTAASSQMPAAAKQQIISAVNSEIGRLSIGGLDLPRGADISKLPRTATNRISEAAPLSRDYSPLPPLPTVSSVPPPHVLAPSGAIAEDSHLTLRCALLGDEDRSDACETIDKDTVLIVRADEAYPRGVAMRFLRHGDSRAEVDLPAMSAGETRKVRVPAALCNGVVRSTVEIDALGANGPRGVLPAKVGDYDLRC